MKNEIQLQAKESAKWLLSQPALDKDGKPVMLYGKPQNNMDLIMAGMLDNARKGNVAPAMNLLTISGVLGEEDEEKRRDVELKKEEAAKKYKKQLENIKSYIARKLKEAGTYDTTVTYAIEIAAVNILLYRKLAAEVLPDNQTLVNVETSREGATRKKASPLLGELQRQMEKTSASLRDLSMTVRLCQTKNEPEDNFTKLLKEWNEE